MNQPATRFSPQQLDELRRRVSLSGVVGQVVALKRSGREFSGLCPFHQERSPSFTVVDEKGFAHCFGCGWHGDAIRFVMDWRGDSFLEAVQSLSEGAGVTLSAEPATPRRELERPVPNADLVDSLTVAQHIWSTAQRAEGEIVEDWLRFRGLDVESDNVRAAIRRLRFHPRCPVTPWRAWEQPEAAWLTAPAMVGLIERISGPRWDRRREPIGVHVTYLASNGRGKAILPPDGRGRARPTRKMFGESARGAVFLSPVDPPPSDLMGCPLVTGEGIETVLSAMDLQPGPVRGAAALSLNNLQGFPILGRNGELPMWNLRPDPERPPFLMPDAGPVIVAVDSDMKALTGPRDEGVKVQDRKGERYARRHIGGLERAEMCATLGVKAWRDAGAYPVSAIRPPISMDFNDMRRAG